MRKSRFTEEQIVRILQEYAAGAKVTEPQKAMFARARKEAGDAALSGWRSVMEVMARGTPWDELKAGGGREDD